MVNNDDAPLSPLEATLRRLHGSRVEITVAGTDVDRVEKIVDRKLEEHARRQEREERMEWS